MRYNFNPVFNMNPMAAAAASQAASGLISGITGLIQRGQANKWLKRNPTPIEAIPREILEGQGIANNMANIGLPSEIYNNSMRQIRRQQLTALSSARSRRGALTALPGLTAVSNDAIANLNAADAEARMNNQRYAIGVGNQVAAVKRDLYDKNIRRPYDMKRDEMMGQLGSGNQNIVGGLDKIFAAGGSYASGLTGGYGNGMSGSLGRGALTGGGMATSLGRGGLSAFMGG